MQKNHFLGYGLLCVLILVFVGVGCGTKTIESTEDFYSGSVEFVYSDPFVVQNRDAIEAELGVRGLEIFAEPQQFSMSLPEVFTEQDWGLQQVVCEAGGYDITPYAGQDLLLTAYSLKGGVGDWFIVNAWVLSQGDKVVCVYKTRTEPGGEGEIMTVDAW